MNTLRKRSAEQGRARRGHDNAAADLRNSQRQVYFTEFLRCQVNRLRSGSIETGCFALDEVLTRGDTLKAAGTAHIGCEVSVLAAIA